MAQQFRNSTDGVKAIGDNFSKLQNRHAPHISQPSGLFQSWWACFEAVWPALHPPHGFKTVEVLVGPQRIQVYLLQVILCRQVILVVICRALATGF